MRKKLKSHPGLVCRVSGQGSQVEVKNVCVKPNKRGMNLCEITKSREDKGTNWTLIPDFDGGLRVK